MLIKPETRGGILRRVMLVLLAMILTFTPSGLVYAALPDEATLDMNDANGIYYYNGSGGIDCGPGSVGLVDGEGNEAYVWNWFARAGISGVSNNAAVIAGIVGNMRLESWNYETQYGANPFEWGQSPGYPYPFYGLVMWDSHYEPGIPEMIRENGWWQYLHTINEAPNVPPDILTQAINMQLDYLTKHVNFELFLKNLDRVSDKKPESYAELFLVTVERAINGSDLLQDSGVLSFAQNNMGSSGWYQGAAGRREAARLMYDQFANSTTSFVATPGVDAEGWVGGIEGLQKEPANIALTDDIVLDKFSTANGKPNAIILHYTAGLTAGLAAYGGNYYPAHFTIDLKNKKGFQHFPLSKPSLAVSTYDGYAIQIEIVGCGYNGEGFGVDAGCMRASGGYSLDQLQDADWDYLAYYLNAISQYTGIPLTSSVVWDKTHRELSDAEMKSYKGVLGHMHVPGNGKVDPGNIWPDVEAALKRNPSSTYNDACIPSGATGLVSGGMTLEQAKKFMQQYYDMADPSIHYSGTVTIGNTTIATKSACSYGENWGGQRNNHNFLNNCPIVPYWFVNAFTSQKLTEIDNGGSMAETVARLIDGVTLSDTPKVYSVFSRRGGDYGHTGVVLGIDVAKDVIIVGEAGCNYWIENDWPGAHSYSLSQYSSSEYVYAVLDTILVGV